MILYIILSLITAVLLNFFLIHIFPSAKNSILLFSPLLFIEHLCCIWFVNQEKRREKAAAESYEYRV